MGDLLKDLALPTHEIDLLLVNGESSLLERNLATGDRIAIYPVFERFEISGETKLREGGLRVPIFLLPVHLSKTARLLRLLGFDAAIGEISSQQALVKRASNESRILVCADTAGARLIKVDRLQLVKSANASGQAQEILKALDLTALARPFTRCLLCNSLLELREQTEARGFVPAVVVEAHRSFLLCLSCKKFYWQGSHFIRLHETAASLLEYDQTRAGQPSV